LAAAYAEIRKNLDELIERERRLREGAEGPDRAESGERELLFEDVARGSLFLRYLNAAHSTFLRAVGKLLELRKEPLDDSRDRASCYGPPNEPEAPDDGPQPSVGAATCDDTKPLGRAPSGGSWLAPESMSYRANESVSSINKIL
jgi:hypothetical protein